MSDVCRKPLNILFSFFEVQRVKKRKKKVQAVNRFKVNDVFSVPLMAKMYIHAIHISHHHHMLQRSKKKLFDFLNLCVSSLRREHANLLCIVPVLSDESFRTL